MNGEFRWMPQRGMYVLTISANRIDHHFEADPKFLNTDDLWMQLLKEVADFLAARGTDVERVKTKMKDYADIYMSTAYDEIQQEQDRAAGGSDDIVGSVGSGGSTADAAGELVSAGSEASGSSANSAGSPAPVAWDNFPESDRPCAADADAVGRAAAIEVQPD